MSRKLGLRPAFPRAVTEDYIELLNNSRPAQDAGQELNDDDDDDDCSTTPKQGERKQQPIACVYESLAGHRKRVKEKTEQWKKKYRYVGWRMGVASGFCAAVFVCLCNIVLLIVGATRYSDGFNGGIAVLAMGQAASMSRYSTAYHILINVLSTILLGASNYTMQVLSSPTRQEVNRVHSRGSWLDIGILSTRNLKHISKWRLALWVALVLSSVPLHLFYNSAIFEVTVVNEYRVNFMHIDSPEYVQLNATACRNSTSNACPPTGLSTPTYLNLTNDLWRTYYNSKYVSTVRDLYLIIDRVGYDLPGREASATSTTSVTIPWPPPYMVQVNDNLGYTKKAPTLDKTGSLSYPTGYRTFFYHPAFAFAEQSDNQSAIQLSLYFMIIVITSNLVKAAVMLTVLLDEEVGSCENAYLVTCGDAISSFLAEPDSLTSGLCAASRGELLGIDYKHQSPEEQWQREAENVGKSGHIWRPKDRFWGSAISSNRRCFVTILCLGSLSIGFVMLAVGDVAIDGWGTASNQYLDIGQGLKFTTAGILLNAWIANIPQLILSVVYFSFNGLYTSMALAKEWNHLASEKKGLRVTNPQGEQRGTYFLQLPYRWSLPLTVTSGSLHWLISQTLFLVQITVKDTQGNTDLSSSVSACGYSAASLLALLVVGTVLTIVTCVVSFFGTTDKLPFAASCSLVISAACHPPPDDKDAHLEKVQWGVTSGVPEDGTRHCAITSQEVTPPEVGQRYA